MTTFLVNTNRFKGCWANDMKNGVGNFTFLDKGQILWDHWKDVIAKCGSLWTLTDNIHPIPVFPIPEIYSSY